MPFHQLHKLSIVYRFLYHRKHRRRRNHRRLHPRHLRLPPRHLRRRRLRPRRAPPRNLLQTAQRMAARRVGHRYRLLHQRRTRTLHRTLRQRPPARPRPHPRPRRAHLLFHPPRHQARRPLLLRALRPLPHPRSRPPIHGRESPRDPRPRHVR